MAQTIADLWAVVSVSRLRWELARLLPWLRGMGSRSDFLDRAQADTVSLSQSSINGARFGHTHCRTVHQRRGIGGIGIAVADKAFARNLTKTPTPLRDARPRATKRTTMRKESLCLHILRRRPAIQLEVRLRPATHGWSSESNLTKFFPVVIVRHLVTLTPPRTRRDAHCQTPAMAP